MSRITIYGSSGNVRYPADGSDISDSATEDIRDRFFQNVQLEYDASERSLYTFFKASTGTPEQFFAQYHSDSIANIFGNTRSTLTNLAENELEWAFADPKDSPGHRTFLELADIDPTEPEKYDDEVIRRILPSEALDFATPDRQTAVGLLKYFVFSYDGEYSVAVSEDGRQGVLSDVDIVIKPGAVAAGVEAIDGSREKIAHETTDAKADHVFDQIRAAKSSVDTQGTATIGEYVVNSFQRSPIDVGQYGYAIYTSSEAKLRKRGDIKYTAGIAGLLALLVSLWYTGVHTSLRGLIEALPDGTTPVRYVDIEPIPHNIVFPSFLVVLICWGALLVFTIWIRAITSDSESERGPAQRTLPNQVESEIASTVQSAAQSPFSKPTAVLSTLGERFDSGSSEIRLSTRRLVRLSRTRDAIIGVTSGSVIAGGIGYLFGSYAIDPLVDNWDYLALGSIVVSFLVVVGAVAYSIRQPVFNIVTSISAKGILLVTVLLGSITGLYAVIEFTDIDDLYLLAGAVVIVIILLALALWSLLSSDTDSLKNNVSTSSSQSTDRTQSQKQKQRDARGSTHDHTSGAKSTPSMNDQYGGSSGWFSPKLLVAFGGLCLLLLALGAVILLSGDGSFIEALSDR